MHPLHPIWFIEKDLMHTLIFVFVLLYLIKCIYTFKYLRIDENWKTANILFRLGLDELNNNDIRIETFYYWKCWMFGTCCISQFNSLSYVQIIDEIYTHEKSSGWNLFEYNFLIMQRIREKKTTWVVFCLLFNMSKEKAKFLVSCLINYKASNPH